MMLTKLAEKIGISAWEIRYRNAIRPGQVLPNGQIVDESTGLVETLEAVKDVFENNQYVGIACAMKNAGVGVGIPDFGRAILAIKDGKAHIRSGASCIGQGLGTVLVQMTIENTDLTSEDIVYEAANTINAPDSGTTSGSRQTLVTGEAMRRACELYNEARKTKSLAELEEKEEERRNRRERFYDDKGGSKQRKRRHIYIFSAEDLDNEDIIAMVESTPTYLRNKTTIDKIRGKASLKEEITPEEAVDESGLITF